jgi:VWFA-related protein
MASAFRSIALTAAVLTLAGAHSGAQQAQQTPQTPPGSQAPTEQQPPPVFRTGINFVRVDVILTDKNGNQITDLKASDFDVTEDNKPQKIETFKLIKLDGGVQEAIKEPPRQIRTDFDEEAEAARDDVRLFAIFLDDYHVRRGTSMSVRKQLTQFVDTQIGPSDMIGVMYPLESTYSVRMTRNHAAVSKGLEQFTGRKYDYRPMNQMEELYAHYPAETVEMVRNQVSISAIKGLIVHMGSLKEGRKSLILVSEGYTNMLPPQMRNADAQLPGFGNPNFNNPLAGVGDPNEDRAAFFAKVDMETELREIYDLANKNNVSIYSVDPRGLPVFEFDINESVGGQTDSKFLNETQDTLRELAENTDGRAIVNRNDIAGGMKQITRDASAYYLIGYNSSQAPSDGKFHEIKVRVKRSGVQVRARKGYWAMTADDTARALAGPKFTAPKPVEVALAAATARPSSASVIRTWIGTARGENGKTRVTFVWEPIARATSARPNDDPSRVSLMAVGTDGMPFFRARVPDVAIASTTPASAAVAGGAASAGQAKGPMRVTFDAVPGKMQLRVSVEGAGAQILDTETREITIPDLTSAQALLGTPEVHRARTAREFQQLKADADAVPTTVREFSRTDRLLIRVPAYGPAGASPVLNVHLLNRAGAPMSELQAGPAPASSAQQIDLPLAGLAPGEYLVEIKSGEAGDETKELVGFRVTG